MPITDVVFDVSTNDCLAESGVALFLGINRPTSYRSGQTLLQEAGCRQTVFLRSAKIGTDRGIVIVRRMSFQWLDNDHKIRRRVSFCALTVLLNDCTLSSIKCSIRYIKECLSTENATPSWILHLLHVILKFSEKAVICVRVFWMTLWSFI